MAERLVGEGFLSYDDLSVIEPEDLMEMGGLSEEAVDEIVTEAERRATIAEEQAADQRRRQRELEQIEAASGAEAGGQTLSAEEEPQEPAPSGEEVPDLSGAAEVEGGEVQDAVTEEQESQE